MYYLDKIFTLWRIFTISSYFLNHTLEHSIKSFTHNWRIIIRLNKFTNWLSLWWRCQLSDNHRFITLSLWYLAIWTDIWLSIAMRLLIIVFNILSESSLAIVLTTVLNIFHLLRTLIERLISGLWNWWSSLWCISFRVLVILSQILFRLAICWSLPLGFCNLILYCWS